MSAPTTCERALRQAWRQADLQVARNLAALCYGKETAARNVAHLAQSAVAATRQRRQLAASLAEHSVVRPIVAQDGPSRTVMQVVHAATQTGTLRPPVEPPVLLSLRQRFSAA